MALRKMTDREYQVIEFADGIGINVPDFVDIGEGNNCQRPEDLTPEENAEYSELVMIYLLHKQIDNQAELLAELVSIRKWVTFFGVLVLLPLILLAAVLLVGIMGGVAGSFLAH